MIEIGKIMTLKIVKILDHGAYLGEEINADMNSRILLPRKQVKKNAQVGDEVEVFIYKDSEDRPIATTTHPMITLGECALLKVKEISDIGAFMDWGLDKDLLLPFSEQTCKVREGKTYPVCLYLDKSSRLCATQKLYKHLRTDSEYQENDWVDGIVYEITDNHGAYVIVDGKYSGLILKQDVHKSIRVGESVHCRVTKVREDGKLTLGFTEKAYVQMDKDAELIMDTILSYDGTLPFNDKADKQVIEDEFGMSKNAFKRGVGRLLKQGKIEIGENCIKAKN